METFRNPPPRKDCLAAGTLILTSRGPIAVEQMQVGDLVLARHATTGETAFKPVIRTTTRQPEPLVELSFDGQTIRASGGHPFWISGQGWVKARDIEPSMYLHGLAEPARITEVLRVTDPEPSFNLIVDDFHSYFVQAGNVRVLSHDNTMREAVRTTVPGLVQTKREK